MDQGSMQTAAGSLGCAASESGVDGGPEPQRGWSGREAAGAVVFAAAAAAAGLWLMLLGRGLTFFYDEWDFIDTRGQSFWHEVVQPHNGHPSMLPYTAYQLLLHTVGLGHYWPYRLVLVVLDLLIGWLLYRLLRRRIHPAVAASAAGVLMLAGPAWQDLLWAFQIGFMGSVAAGLGALLLLDADVTDWRHDGAAAACLLLAVGCSGVGLPFVAGSFVELVWRRRWQSLWAPLAPLVAFVAWYVAYDRSQAQATLPSVHAAVDYYGHSLAETAGYLVGGNGTVGAVLMAAIGLLCVVAFLRSPARSARLLCAIVGLLSFLTLTVLVRTLSLPIASRYVVPAGCFEILVAAEAIRLGLAGWKPASWRGHARTLQFVVTGTAALAVAAAGVVVYRNSSPMDAGAQFLASWSSSVRTALGAVQYEGHRISPAFRPLPSLAPQIVTGPFLAATAAYGSPAVPGSALASLPSDQRQLVDTTLLAALPLRAHPQQTASSGSTCGRLLTSGGTTLLSIHLPPSGLVLSSSVPAQFDVRAREVGTAWEKAGTIALPGGRSDSEVLRWTGRLVQGIEWRVALVPTGGGSPASLPTLTCEPAR